MAGRAGGTDRFHEPGAVAFVSDARSAPATTARRAWLLNFDADDELAAPRGYAPRAEVQARFAALAARVGPLLAPGDVLLEAGRGATPGLEGRAFCPTPRACATLAAAGARVPAAPPLSVLRQVNDRAFHAELGLDLPGAAFARSVDEALAVLSGASPTGRWLAKRAFGFAGRGRHVFDGSDVHDEKARTWLERSLRGGGLEIGPLCERLADFALHGFVDPAGALMLGAPTTQVIDAAGAWQTTRRARAGELAPDEALALRDEAARTGDALRRTGYFGPFGIDAFRWRSPDGAARFLARCDVNARYTMGWATGMGELRPDLLRAP